MVDLRLAELLVPLSLVTDPGMDDARGEAARSCLLATALARSAGFSEDDALFGPLEGEHPDPARIAG